MKAVGTKTDAKTNATPMTGPVISFIALRLASFAESPASIWCSTASTTTMASSTTKPIAKTSQNSDSVLMEKPNSGKNIKEPINETGTTNDGMKVARQQCRKR